MESMTLDVRRAVPQDEEKLAELWWVMQASHHSYEPRLYADKGEAACKASWRQHFRELLGNDDALIVVAVCGEDAVGMMVAQFRSRPPIYAIPRVLAIDSTVVQPDHRQQGAFRSMLQFLETAAKERGVGVVQLTVHKDNEAKHAYQRTGFASVTEGMVKWIE